MALTERTPDEQAQNALNSAMDSVTLIDQLVAAGEHSEQIDSRVDANYRHLEIVLNRDNVKSYVANTSTSTSALTGAIASAKTFLGR